MVRSAGALLMGFALAGCPGNDDDGGTSLSTSAAYGVPTTAGASTGEDTSTTGSSSGSGSTSTGPGDTETDTDGSTGLSPDYGVPTTSGG